MPNENVEPEQTGINLVLICFYEAGCCLMAFYSY